MEFVIFVVGCLIFSFAFLYFFSDEHCDKEIQKMIEKNIREKEKNNDR